MPFGPSPTPRGSPLTAQARGFGRRCRQRVGGRVKRLRSPCRLAMAVLDAASLHAWKACWRAQNDWPLEPHHQDMGQGATERSVSVVGNVRCSLGQGCAWI